MLNSNGSVSSLFLWCLAGCLALWPHATLSQCMGRDLAMHSKEKEESDSCSSCVRFKVSVSKFIRVAGSDNFVDGYGFVYSHTILTVIEPVELLGRRLTVEHTAVPDDGSIWLSVGEEAFIELSPVGLESPTVIIPAREVRIQKTEP